MGNTVITLNKWHRIATKIYNYMLANEHQDNALAIALHVENVKNQVSKIIIDKGESSTSFYLVSDNNEVIHTHRTTNLLLRFSNVADKLMVCDNVVHAKVDNQLPVLLKRGR